MHRLAPVLRRRWTEERLAQQAVRLARRNQALGDFAALVAHELKTPLELARLQDDPSVGVERALELVDVLLEAAKPSRPPRLRFGSRLPGGGAARSWPDRGRGHHRPAAGGSAAGHGVAVLLRNLVANAVAAGHGTSMSRPSRRPVPGG